MARGERLEGRVRAVGRGGDGVVETDRGIVLVPGALPGERVLIEPVQSKRGANRGRLRALIEHSPGRVEAPCPEAAHCGGCPLMIADPALQQEIKLAFLRDACRDVPGADALEVEWVASPSTIGYRRRARLAWHGSTVGYRQLRSKRVTAVRDCMVLNDTLRRAFAVVRETLSGVLEGTGEIEIELASDDQVVVGARYDGDPPPSLFAGCAALLESSVVAGVTLRSAGAGAAASWGMTNIALPTEAGVLEAPAGAFSQANDAINRVLVSTVVELAEPGGRRVLELFSGVGNFTVALAAERPASLVAVEQHAPSVEACRRNLARLGVDARVTVGDANAPPKGRYDVCVLDPPRQGARALFERHGLLPGPRRVVYVSCDTATLARDLGFATDAGYRIDRAIGFDMFPQTAHLESVVRLVRD